MAEMMDSEREAFEKWWSTTGCVFSCNRDMALAGWQARAPLTQPAQAVDVGAIREVIAYLKIGHRFDMDMADKLTRAIGNAQAEGWRPIETAPKDGTSILVSDGRPDGCLVVAWHKGEWVYGWHRHDGPMSADDSTHWMPIPTPPQPEE